MKINNEENISESSPLTIEAPKRRQGRPLLGDAPLSKRIIFRLTEDEFTELNNMLEPGEKLRPNIMARDFFIRGLQQKRGMNKGFSQENAKSTNNNANHK